jgi:uncharacterized protein
LNSILCKIEIEANPQSADHAPSDLLDSSALVKRYISESGSTWVLGLFDPVLDNEIFVAAITSAEMIAAVTRRSRSGSINAADTTLVCSQFRNDWQIDYQTVEITEGVINSGMTLTLCVCGQRVKCSCC